MCRGHPIYDKDVHPQQVIDALMLGNSIAGICSKMKIARTTFYEWKKLYKEFRQAFEIGKEHAELFWEMIAPPNNAAVWIFIMKNRFGWRDHIETHESIEKKNPKEMSTDELQEEYTNATSNK